MNAETRRARAELVKQAQRKSGQAFIHVDNRLKGNALETILGMTNSS